MAIDIPAHGAQFRRVRRSAESFVARRAGEGRRGISERALAEEERAVSDTAQDKEVNRYVASAALESLPSAAPPSPSSVMRPRWIVEWKIDEATGDQWAKVRIAVLGYMGPEHENRPTAAPTAARTSRRVVLHIVSWLGMKWYAADVTQRRAV